MRKIIQWMLVIGLAFAPVLSSAPAEATLAHTWVASTGSDGNNCDRPTPCATFIGAYNNTTVGGEITCVDSGNFGGLGITHSLTVNCEGYVASDTGTTIAVAFMTITTGPGDVVTLRGLDLDGLGQSANQSCVDPVNFGGVVHFSGAGTLHLQKMKINHITGLDCGVQFTPSGSAVLDITDSDISDNGSSGTAAGVYVGPQSGAEADVVIDHTHIERNYFGIIFDGTQGGIIHGVIRDSVVSGNTENGITASTTSSNILLLIDQSTVSGSLHGLVAGGANAAIMVRNTSVFGNTAAGLFTVNGGQLFSYGNNSVDGNNGNNGAFTGMATLK
jgi:hypothetical protein